MAKAAVTAKPKGKDDVGSSLEALMASAAPLRRLVTQAKARGSITLDQLNAALPPDTNPEQIDELISGLEARGIGVSRDESSDSQQQGEPAAANENEQGEAEAESDAEDEGESKTQTIGDEDLGRTDDPVRMYLREMGTIELLSREGEIEIAKRIESGRNMVLEALCESPLTMRAVIGWRDAIRDGRVLLRDIIDLDATNDAGPQPEAEGDGKAAVAAAPATGSLPLRHVRQRRGAATAGRGTAGNGEARPDAAASGEDEAEAVKVEGGESEEEDFDDDTAVALGHGGQAARRRARDLRPHRRDLRQPARPAGRAAGGAAGGRGGRARARPQLRGGARDRGRADEAGPAQQRPGRGAWSSSCST